MRRSSLVVLLVVGALLVPAAVFASHQFNDVPDSHTFHTGISWMKDNNITVGCNPPANTNYCPDDNVTRGQMATFMKRLADNQVVDAGALGGRTADFYQGSAAGVLISTLTPANLVRTRLATVPGFEVPQDGGALVVGADFLMAATVSGDAAIVWIEVDGSGACTIATLPQTGVFHLFAAEPLANAGTRTAAAANAGTHRVDLCAVTNGGVSFEPGAMTVQWAETTQVGTTASASTGVTPEAKLAELSSATFAE
jgi:hypothetical protein